MAVVEAGLGGRYDATSVIDAPVTVLTNVGLEHTRWLGPTMRDIAEEKLAVVRPGGTLVLGAGLHADALAVARTRGRRAAARGIVQVAPRRAAVAALRRRARAPFSGATSRSPAAAAEALPARCGDRARRAGRARGRRRDRGAGRLQVVDERSAHGARRRAQPRRRRGAGGVAAGGARRPRGRARDGRARGQGRREHARARCCRRVRARVVHRAAQPRALSPAALQSLARQLGFDAVVCEPQPRRALAQARRWAGRRGRAIDWQAPCSPRARSTSSAICCRRARTPPSRARGRLPAASRWAHERRRPLRAHDDRRGRADRRARDPRLLRRRLLGASVPAAFAA